MLASCARLNKPLHGTHEDLPGGDVAQMKLITSSFGWALTGHRLVSTKDGGKTWSDLTPIDAPGNSLKAAFFLDETRVWTVADTGGALRVYRSIDHGHSWRATALGAGAPDTGTSTMEFADAGHGWIETAGALYRTVDAGATWQRVALPAGSSRVAFANATNGVAAAGALAYFTADGGSTWKRAALASPVALGAPRLFETTDVILAAAPKDGKLLAFRSADAGATWTVQQVSALPSGFPGPIVGEALSATRTKWLAGGDLITVNGDGRFGVDTVAGLPYSIVALSFATDARGWAISGTSCAPFPDPCEPHRLFETRDGGTNWTKLNP